MRKLIVTTFVTLDGVMQAPGGPEEDTSGGFSLGGWSMNHWDDKMGQEVLAGIVGKPFDLLLGRKTYDIFAGYWPHQTEPAQIAKPFNECTKYVASRQHLDLEWQPSVLLEGDDVAGQIAELKKGDGPELQVHGSGNLIQTLMANNLIDRYYVWTFPMVIGSGKRLFAEGTIPGALKLVDSVTSTTGVVIGTYEPAGDIVPGT